MHQRGIEVDDSADWAARIYALEARIAEAEAHQAITNLKSKYGMLADARYSRGGVKSLPELEALAERVASLFTEDGVWDGGSELGVCVGRDAIRERFERPTLKYSWHFFVKPDIRVEGFVAQGTWDVLALCTTRADQAMWMVGVEHDEYACVDGEWLHTRMKLDAKLMVPHAKGWAEQR